MFINKKSASYNFKSSYLENEKIGFDLLFGNRIIFYEETDMWIGTYMRSSTMFNICKKYEELSNPAKYTKISVEPFTAGAKCNRLRKKLWEELSA